MLANDALELIDQPPPGEPFAHTEVPIAEGGPLEMLALLAATRSENGVD
jgi:hypothetical protein